MHAHAARALGLSICAVGAAACQDATFAEHEERQDAASQGDAAIDALLDAGAIPWVEILADDFGARLYWDARPGATYSVYRSTMEWAQLWEQAPPNPDFAISDPGVERIADHVVRDFHHDYTGFPLLLGDPFAPGGAFYRVVEHSPEGDLVSAPVGRIPITTLYSSPNAPEPFLYLHNKLAVCLDPSPPHAHRRMLLDEQTVSIHWWDPLSQTYHSDDPPFWSVLELGLGSVFSVRTQPSYDHHGGGFNPYQLTGRVPMPSELLLGLYEGNNAVIWPVTAESTRASAVLDDPDGTPHAIAIGWWAPGTQVLRWYPEIPPGHRPGIVETVSGDFRLTPCGAYYVYIDAGQPEGTDLGEALDLMWPPPLAGSTP